jgi:hypothetical protein
VRFSFFSKYNNVLNIEQIILWMMIQWSTTVLMQIWDDRTIYFEFFDVVESNPMFFIRW